MSRSLDRACAALTGPGRGAMRWECRPRLCQSPKSVAITARSPPLWRHTTIIRSQMVCGPDRSPTTPSRRSSFPHGSLRTRDPSMSPGGRWTCWLGRPISRNGAFGTFSGLRRGPHWTPCFRERLFPKPGDAGPRTGRRCVSYLSESRRPAHPCPACSTGSSRLAV